MDPATSGALTAGVALGYAVGYTTAVARRAWADYRDTRAKVPVLRRTAWRTGTAATIRAIAVGVVLLAAAVWAAHGPR